VSAYSSAPSAQSPVHPYRASLVLLGVLALSLTLLVGTFASGQTAPGALPAEIRVALVQGSSSCQLGATSAWQILEPSSGRTLHSSLSAGSVTLSVQSGLLFFADQGPFAGPLVVSLSGGAGSGRMTAIGRQYRGWLEASVGADGRLLVVNQLPLEDYLLGVVPREMPHTWPQEALRAQAVAARTYAVSQIQASRAAGSPFAVVATS